MTEQQSIINRFSPETGKPNPVSYREFKLMDRHERKQFVAPLSKKERSDFSLAYGAKDLMLTAKEKYAMQKEIVDKLSKRENKSLGDKLELAFEKMRLHALKLPEKPPVFLRKLRTPRDPKEIAWLIPKYIKEAKSPYLISA